jgi:hypothetical protein
VGGAPGGGAPPPPPLPRPPHPPAGAPPRGAAPTPYDAQTTAPESVGSRWTLSFLTRLIGHFSWK